MKQTDASRSTPEDLLRAMDLQLAAARTARAKPAGGPRLVLLISGLLFIVAACAVALFILQQMLGELPHAPAGEAPAYGAVSVAGENK